MHVWKYLNQRVIEWKIFQGCFKNKKEKAHEEIEFHNSIQDLIFTTVYQLLKSAWKNAWMGILSFPVLLKGILKEGGIVLIVLGGTW